MGAHSVLWLLVPWCLSTRSSLSTVLRLDIPFIGPVSYKQITLMMWKMRRKKNQIYKKFLSSLWVQLYDYIDIVRLLMFVLFKDEPNVMYNIYQLSIIHSYTKPFWIFLCYRPGMWFPVYLSVQCPVLVTSAHSGDRVFYWRALLRPSVCITISIIGRSIVMLEDQWYY